MKDKIKEFFQTETGERIVYEIRSFLITFGSVLITLAGADKFTSLDVIITNKEVIIGSIGMAFARTVLIYLLSFLGITSYREFTRSYK